jgi:hypothetical protein
MIFRTTLATYLVSLLINSIYLYIDIRNSKTNATFNDYFLIFTPIVNTVATVSIITIEALLIIHSVDWSKIFKNKNKQ